MRYSEIMFLQKRMINGTMYTYVEHSFRIGDSVQKAGFILDKDNKDYNEKIIEKIAKARAAYFVGHFQTYFSLQELIAIEQEKVFFQIFFEVLDDKSKREILAEFVRLFLANSMELEGSTITPPLAEKIERQKKVVLPESDVQLYTNSHAAVFEMMQSHFRSVVSFSQLHRLIYDGVYVHAGKFKTQVNTFGYMEKAMTSAPQDVRRDLQNVLHAYKDRKVYSFLKPLLFHLNYQKVHPFADGNSRLGRILLVTQMFTLGYPPLMFKGDMSFQIRETLVEYCNRGHLDFCRLAYEQYIQTSQKFWRPMITKFLFK